LRQHALADVNPRDQAVGTDLPSHLGGQEAGTDAHVEHPLPRSTADELPDFLTSESAGGLAEGLDAVARTPKARLRREVGTVARSQPVRAGARVTADAAHGWLAELIGSTRANVLEAAARGGTPPRSRARSGCYCQRRASTWRSCVARA
jgi:hypothetical protein